MVENFNCMKPDCLGYVALDEKPRVNYLAMQTNNTNEYGQSLKYTMTFIGHCVACNTEHQIVIADGGYEYRQTIK